MSSLPDLLGVSVAEALRLLGLIAHQSGDYQTAVDLISRAVAVNPSAQMYCNLGVVLQALQKFDLAIENFKQAIAVQPQYAEAYFNMGGSYQAKGDWTQAKNSYQNAIAINPNYAEAHINLGVVFFEQERFEEAINSYRKALDIDPANVDAHINMGNTFRSIRQLDKAIECYQIALRINPQLAVAHNNIAALLQFQSKHDEAISHYHKALTTEPNYVYHSNFISAIDMHPDIDSTTVQQERKNWSRLYANHLLQDIPYLNVPLANRTLRVGYVSSDFIEKHSAATVFSAALMAFNREKFEVYAYSNSSVQDSRSRCLQQSVTCWKNIAHLSDEALTKEIRDDQIDILVDLNGISPGNRLFVFARKPAPIQITAWGYIGGTGMQAMDVFFADSVVVPPEEKHLYAEEVVYLPNIVCYYPFEPFPAINTLPALSGGGITFGSFNRLAKVTQQTFETWAQVLLAVPNSRMILKTPELDILGERERTLNHFISKGIASDRITLSGWSSWVEHKVAFNQVDISLDPYPHGGGVTTLEGIMMGVSVVTLRWPTVPGRLSAAILTPLGLTDWIAETPEQYVEIAVRKSSDLMALAVLRKQLRKTMTDSLVGNPKAYAQAVEQQYRLLWKQWCSQFIASETER